MPRPYLRPMKSHLCKGHTGIGTLTSSGDCSVVKLRNSCISPTQRTRPDRQWVLNSNLLKAVRQMQIEGQPRRQFAVLRAAAGGRRRERETKGPKHYFLSALPIFT